MKFYNREDELIILKKADKLKEKHFIMTILIGRRRVGKTTLALQPFSSSITLYLFVSKKNEALLDLTILKLYVIIHINQSRS